MRVMDWKKWKLQVQQCDWFNRNGNWVKRWKLKTLEGFQIFVDLLFSWKFSECLNICRVNRKPNVCRVGELLWKSRDGNKSFWLCYREFRTQVKVMRMLIFDILSELSRLRHSEFHSGFRRIDLIFDFSEYLNFFMEKYPPTHQKLLPCSCCIKLNKLEWISEFHCKSKIFWAIFQKSSSHLRLSQSSTVPSTSGQSSSIE